MDRYLVSGAFALLIFQVTWLLSSLGLIDPLHMRPNPVASDKSVIGQLIQKRENVKRKGADSIIWEDSNTNDTLYRYDSVLTLDNSTAQLNLEGDVKLHIHENTLVMLEPLEKDSEDSLRVRFYKGQLRSRNSGQRLAVGSGEWMVEAKPGTDLSLRTLEKDRVEVEINKGEVQLQNKNSGEIKSITNGKKLVLAQAEIEKIQDVTADLKIESPREARIYSHDFPLVVPLKWSGDARFLRLIKPSREEVRTMLPAGGSRGSGSDDDGATDRTGAIDPRSYTLSLEPGTYSLALEGSDGSVSTSSTLEIVPAPKIRYLNPLPRDRITLSANYLFSWYPAEDVGRYEVHLDKGSVDTTRALGAAGVTGATGATGAAGATALKKDSALPYANVQSATPGEYVWSVYAYDSDGFVIPPFYSLPVYFTPNPLAAPRLNAPGVAPSATPEEQRAPADENKPPEEKKSSTPDGAWFWNFILPSAHAQEPAQAVGSEMKRQVVFSWYPVEGADFYIIEISSKPDFLKPEVIKKVSRTDFVWVDFKDESYYWRVAGGTNDGRMGLFSEAEKFDVLALKTKAAGVTGPAIQYVEKPVAYRPNPQPTPKPTADSKPAPAPQSQKPIVDALKQDTAETEAEKLSANEPQPEPEKLKIPSFFDVAAHFDFWMITQENSNLEQAQFRGMALPSFSLAKSWNVSYEKTYVTQLAWHSLEWKPENLPFQKTFNTEIFDFKVFREINGWTLGFALRQFPLIEREALEAVKPNETLFYGLLINYQNSLTQSTFWQTQPTLLYGDGYYQIGLENKIDFYVQDREDTSLGSRSGLYHGGYFDVFGVSGENSHKSFFFRTGYALGYRW